jgi:sugar (Glycoside-Pentoside-Hexuronide) transporter
MKLFTKSREQNVELGIMERMAYMSGNVGIAFINTIIASFLLFFYTDVLFLNAGILGTIILASRLFDGITDIIMGLIVDRTFSKQGRGRAWIIRMCVPYAVSGILLMLVPTSAPEMIQYIYVFITYNLCNAVCLTAVYVPYNAMSVNLTSNTKERGIISVMVMVGAVVGTLIVQSTVDAATTALGGDVRAWRIVIAVYALCGLLCHLFCIACTRERCIPSTSAQEEVPHVDIKLELKALFANKYWLLAIGSVFFGLFSTSILGGAGMYYAKGVLGDTAYYASFANVMAVTQLFFLFVAILFVPRIGKRNIILIGMGIITLAALFQGIFPPSLTSAVIFAGLKGIGAGFAGAVFYALVADTIDYGEWKVGQKAEGVGMSAVTFATKIAQGLSTVLLGWIIDFGGYDGAALTQTNRAVFAVNSAFNFIPAFCCGCVVVIMLFYDLDKKFPDIQKELEDRRNMN